VTVAVEKKPPVKLPNEPTITPQVVAEHGLSPDEYQRVLQIMGRTPTMVELGIFSAMWSEHCSYKSSKVWLKKLPTKAPWVIQGPGENAGVIDIGDGQAAIFKMESHNHPSYIEPYQGAATGVGGILRDVFTMGARPVANLNALRFGDPAHPKTRHLVSGVVAGHRRLRQLHGHPDGGGETNFHAAYNGNILVNAMTVGIAPDRPHLLCGRRGRRAIRWSMSAPRPAATASTAPPWPRPSSTRTARRSGRPCRSAIRSSRSCCSSLPRADGDRRDRRHPGHGAAGLTSSSFEMAAKGGLGVVVELDKVPMRETGMNPYELMLSKARSAC
jgi:phosphoribosylformylglycinamidine synthase